MQKHKRIFHLPWTLAVLGAVGCQQTEQPAPQPTNEVRSNKPFAPERNVPQDDLTAFWSSQLELGGAMYETLDQRQSKNFAYSPTSVAMAMAMTAAGASGAARDEMGATFKFPDDATLHDLMAESTAAFLALAHDATDDVEAQQVNVVNALWPQAGLALYPAFLDTMSESYDSGVYPVDYRTDVEGARLAINQWVSDQTFEKISELLKQGDVSDDTRITLVNAVYLKAPWKHPFDVVDTKEQTFYAANDGAVTAVQTAFMNATVPAKGAVVSDAAGSYRVLELPYGHDDLSFSIVIAECPNNADCDATLLAPPSATQLAGLLAHELNDELYGLSLPKFRIRASTGLKKSLIALGMVAPFDGGIDKIAADNFAIQDVIHEAFVEIDEKGTEAAAATAVVVGPTSVPNYTEVVINRPFWFVIRDKAVRAPLFIGFVANPADKS